MKLSKLHLFILIISISISISSLSVVVLFILFSSENAIPASSTSVLSTATTNITQSPLDNQSPSLSPAETPDYFQYYTLSPTPSSSIKVTPFSTIATPKLTIEKPIDKIVNARINKYYSEVSELKSNLPKDKKYIALSFDDGPLPKTTPKILNALKKRNVVATFCVVGIQLIDYPNILKEAIANGNEISNHTYNHKLWRKLKSSEIIDQIEKTNSLIKKISGYVCNTVRPPYGIYTESSLNIAKYPLILWSVDPEDWKYKNTSLIINKVVSSARDGDIVILHDIHPATADAVGPIVDALKAKGFAFVTVSEMVASGRVRNGSIK